MRSSFKDRTGEVGINKFGSKMIIEKYNGSQDVLIRFINNNYKTVSTYANFKKGLIRNPFDITVYNIGYIGEGIYKTKENSKITKEYDIWTNMLRRCYSGEFPRYKNVTVCEEWLNFQNFAKWYNENYYKVESQRMELDKDILNKGNNIYSPETCVIVPQRINTLFTKGEAIRGSLPIGVEFNKKDKKYRISCSNNHTGYYDTAEEAFQGYKIFKEKLIKQIAEEYKKQIPENLYKAMITYEVEITD